MIGDARPALTLLIGVALVLLLVACATVANALFIRVTERQRELALRGALGASRARLLRRLLLEGLAIAAAGVGLGVVMALILMPVLRTLVPPAFPRANEIRLNVMLLAYAAGAIALVTALAVVVPARRGTRMEIVSPPATNGTT